MPLDVAGQRRGVLVVASARSEAFSEADLAVVRVVAGWVGTLVNNTELAESARKAQTDLMTERLAQRREIEGERAFLQAVLDSAEVGIVACDADGRLTLFNRAAREWHGAPDEPLAPERWAERYDRYRADGHTRLQLEDIPLVRALREGRVDNAEMAIVPREGPARVLVANGRRITHADGRTAGAVVAMHDITTRALVEDALVSSETRLKVVLGAMAEGIFWGGWGGADHVRQSSGREPDRVPR